MTTEEICIACDACCVHCQIQLAQMRNRIKSIAVYEARFLAKAIIAFLGNEGIGFKIVFANEHKSEHDDCDDCYVYDVKVICKDKETTISNVKISSAYCRTYQRYKFFDELINYMKKEGYYFEQHPICLAVDFHHIFNEKYHYFADETMVVCGKT